MKKFFSLSFSLFLMGSFSLAHALTSLPAQGVDACVASGGAEGVIISGTFTKVTTQGVHSDNGKMAVECQLTGAVLKGNSLVPATDDPNFVYTFKIIHPDLFPGIQICQQGETGVWLIYGAGSWGLQSFVNNGGCDIPLKKESDGKYYASSKSFQFKSSQFKQKFLAGNVVAGKLLSGAPSAAGAGISQGDVNTMIKGMATDIWGNRGGSSNSGGSASNQGGGRTGAEAVNLIYGK